MPKDPFDGRYNSSVNERVRPVLERYGRIFVIVTEMEDGMYTAMVPLFATRNRKCVVYLKEDGEFGLAQGTFRPTYQEITASFPEDIAGSPWAAEVMSDIKKLLLPKGVLKVHTFDERAGTVRRYAGGL